MSRRAAVDVGTNSVRLLVLDDDGAALARQMTITRLGRGVDERGHLDDEALRRTLETIAAYQDRWSALGVDRAHVRIAATSAVRDATDRDRLFDGVRDITGIDAEVLSGDEEAQTSFRGAAGAVEVPGPVTVLDIGGGSTELVVGDGDGHVVGAISLQLGSVRLTERLLLQDPPTDAQVALARAEAMRQLAHAEAVLAERGADVRASGTLVAVAGTATTLAAIDLGLTAYEPEAIHGHRVDRDAVARITAELVAVDSAARATYGPMQPGREDVIHGGAIVLLAVLDHFGLEAMVVSERDILDGLAATAGPR